MKQKEIQTGAKEISKAAHAVDRAITEKRRAVFARFPLLFTLLGTFGVVATFYGFEGVMDQFGLSENPWILLVLGISVLTFTGTLYKKLER